MSIAEAIDEHTDSLRFMQSRFGEMVRDSWRIVSEAIEAHADGHEITGRVVLFSGGNDSTVLAHLFRSWATHAAHANTTVGIEATRQFVRDTCDMWGLAGKNLACWCPLDQPCHADVLLELANAERPPDG